MEMKEAIEELKEMLENANFGNSPKFVARRMKALHLAISLLEDLERIEGSGLIPEEKKHLLHENVGDADYAFGWDVCLSECRNHLLKNWPKVKEITPIIKDFQFPHCLKGEDFCYECKGKNKRLAQSLLDYFDGKLGKEK